MAAQIIVFATKGERAACCADIFHDWEHQPNIFGKETEKLLSTCEELKRICLHHPDYRNLSCKEIKALEKTLLKKIYGIAKSHGVSIKWYGNSIPCEPDRFLVSGHGFDSLAFIQC